MNPVTKVTRKKLIIFMRITFSVKKIKFHQNKNNKLLRNSTKN